MRAVNYILGMRALAAILLNARASEAGGRPPRLEGFPTHLVWQNGPTRWLLFKAAGDFLFSTKVDVDSHVTYDAGCLALYGVESLWAKLCLERQGDGRLDVISVVTHGESDDATSFPASGASIYLKVAKADGAVFVDFLTKAINEKPAQVNGRAARSARVT